ncbi:MAG: RAMP superfamily CRISPR-associated protein [Firmicutes bacterium]|nr:RAMP superfamily CRISPR-associated protein [Bacillota bacterium]
MARSLWEPEESLHIISRLVIEGDLVLETPAHLGGGEDDGLIDLPLLLDSLDGKTPLLTGSSVAGALRSYLRLCFGGQESAAEVLLFGPSKEDEEDEAGRLIVDDALGRASGVEIRAGVRIDERSRTAQEKKLYEIPLWEAGTIFPLHMELQVREEDDKDQLLSALATALEGFRKGEIRFGARKRRGLGLGRVTLWRVRNFDLRNPDDLLTWINQDSELPTSAIPVADISSAFGVTTLPDSREVFSIQAKFFLEGSLMIRSGGGKEDLGPDAVHLHSRQVGGVVRPVLSGTSLAGALRARARKIVRTLVSSERASRLIDEMFGLEIAKGVSPVASRVIVEDSVIEGGRDDLVQSRVSLDRFTGGAREALLFSEQPLFGGQDALVDIRFDLVKPKEYEIGILLLLLKDLWTGDIPLGAESSVGRGRLTGRRAKLVWQRPAPAATMSWDIEAQPEGLVFHEGDPKVLERFVQDLRHHLMEVTG